MNNIQNMAIYLFEKLLTDSTRKKTEKIILKIAIFSFQFKDLISNCR